MQSFNLETVIAPPFLRFIYSFFLPFGILATSYWMANATREKKFEVQIPFYFFTIWSFFLSATFILSAYAQVPTTLIRVISTLFVIIGIFSLFKLMLFLFRSRTTYYGKLCQKSVYEKIDLSLIFLITLSLGLLSLAPISDPDSLDYHLGLPLRVLQFGKLQHFPFWLSAPLVATGDYINLIGLINGTDCLSAVTQYFSLLLLCYVFITFVSRRDPNNNSFYLKLILTPFVLIFLLNSQKSQMIGVCALVIAYILAIEKVSYKYYLPLIFSSFVIKYSFYISGGVFLLTFFFFSKEKVRFALLSIFLYLSLVFPFHLYNYQNYHSPLAPFLSFLMPEHLSFVSHKFSLFLKNYGDGFPLPLGIVIPQSPSLITTVIGLGPLIIFFFKYKKIPYKVYLPFLLALIAAIFLTQKTARFFLPHFLILVFLSSYLIKRKTLFYFERLLTAQCMAFLAVTLVGVATLFPGALTPSLREKVLTRHAYQYSAQTWLDQVLPQNTLILADFRTTSWLPRNFITTSFYHYLQKMSFYLSDYLQAYEKEHPGHEWLFITERDIVKGDPIIPFIDMKPILSKQFYSSTRNPLHYKKFTNKVKIYKVNKEAIINNRSYSLENSY